MHALDAKYPDAEGLLKEAHKALADLERERKAVALYSEGLRHIDAQTWNEALRCFQAIEKLVKDYRDTPTLLTQVRHELEVIRRRQEQAQAEQARREELARAEKTRQEEEARQAQVARLTREINALWQQLETAEANQDWRMVIRRAKSILNRDPSHRRAKNKLAAGYAGRSQTYQPGERQQAIDDLTRAIELVPNQADLYARRATYKFGQAALADLEKALELRPGHAEYKRQRDALKKELADRAARDEAQRALWDGLKSLGLGGKASSGSEPPASVKPSMPGSFEWSGLSLPPKLIFTAKEADEQGVAQAQRGDHRRAITYFDRAIELAPDTAEFYAHRALSYHRLADYARAITDYDRAMDLGRADIALFQNRNRAAEHQPPNPLLI